MTTPKPTFHDLSEFFTPPQIKHLFKTSKRLNYDLDSMITELRPWFLELREQLEEKGLLPEYAAYAVPFAICEGRKKR